MEVSITARNLSMLSSNCFYYPLKIRMIPDQLADQTREAIAEVLDRLQATTLLATQLETQIAETADLVRSLSNTLEQLVSGEREP